MKTITTIIIIIAAIVAFLIVTAIGQAIVDAFIPRIFQYAALFLVVLYFVVRQAVADGQRQ